MLLTSCGQSEILYSDPSTRLSAPEVLAAWNSTSWPFSSVVDVTSPGAPEILSDLRKRHPAPSGVLLASAVSREQVLQWQSEFRKTRFVVLRPDTISSSIPRIAVDQAASWKELARKAGDHPDAHAVAVIDASATADSLGALQEGWKQSGQNLPIVVVLWDHRIAPPDTELKATVTTETTDVFVLGVDPTRIVLPSVGKGLRIHRDLGWTGTEPAGGWRIRLAPSTLGTALHNAVRPGAPAVVYLPWEIVLKTPVSKS